MTGVRWIAGSKGNTYIGLIRHGVRINVEQEPQGWHVTFNGIRMAESYPLLSMAKHEGVLFVSRLLTECLVVLNEEADGTGYDVVPT